jgi:ATP-dependent DNA helicase RecG
MPATRSSNPLPDFLSAPLPPLPGIPEKRAALMKKLGIQNQKQLLFHLPVSLVDRRKNTPLGQAKAGDIITIKLEAEEHQPVPHPSSRRPYRIWCRDEQGERIVLIFFHVKGDYLQRQLPIGQWRIVSGRVEMAGDILTMPHPDYIVPLEREAEVRRVEPVYPLTAGVSNKMILNYLKRALPHLPDYPEWSDAEFIKKQKFVSWKEALFSLHHPQSAEMLEPLSPARQRLAYDELLAHQLALALARRKHTRESGQVLNGDGMLVQKLIASLPFTLTTGQQEVVCELSADMKKGHRMVRLLQGDVGSGKTIVALLLMLQAIEAGTQAALMAPTELLSRQHYNTIQALLNPLGIRVELLTAQSKAKKKLQQDIATGAVHLVIGTHALIEQSVAFKQLGLVVIDEQHRFGVQQRLQLIEKSKGTHVLMMSATPIPRTLALTCYGDMELSTLREKPAGRKPIDTRVLPLSRLMEVVEGLKRVIAQGSRIYWVCPLVAESEDLDLAAAEQRFEAMKVHYPRIGLVHGRMKQADREPTMQAFRKGEIDILIATTVIEVGVDVREATVMVIEHAERFGLSQLHQLRGRVGRGDKPSSCLLLYADSAGRTAHDRLKVMRETEDGFEIAEADMRLRGMGDMVGKKQSGFPDFRHADLSVHTSLLTIARDDAAYILNRDPELTSPRGEAVKKLLDLYDYEVFAGMKL